MNNLESKSIKRLINAGLLLIPVVLIVLVFTTLKRKANGDFFQDSAGFFVNYIFALGYFLIVLINNRPFFKFTQIDKRLIVLSLVLFSISSFTLNNSFVIFAQFTLWVKVYLILFYCAFVGIIYLERIPKLLRYLVYFFLGAGIVLTSYFAIYLAPTYHISIIGLLFLGLSIHLLIPLLLTIAVIVIYTKLEKTKTDRIWFYSGLLIPILTVIVFLIQWGSFKNEIHTSTSSLITRPDNTLPEWVLLCQDMPTDKFSQKIIKGKLVYDTFNNMWRGWGNSTFDEIKRHDPLVNVGIAFLGDINLDRNTRVQILKSQFNARHLVQRKLWSGRSLATIEVLNNIKVFPDYRLAYTEKIITVNNSNQWVNDRQEAAFTFYLPEGSVATSLSLWINGKEEPSRLTTKSKADSAYVNIVGIQSRDPALMHWQEGNTLTVTVFPCTPKENRRFKIGITSPLEMADGILKLQNVYFDGPVPQDILETSQVIFESENNIENIHVPNGFKKGLENNYLYNGKFKPYWEVSCNATKLSQNDFYFNEHSYSVKEIKKQAYNFNPEKIYLDINKSWTKKELNEILTLFSEKQIYVHHDKLIKVDRDNKSEVFNMLGKKNFSLFPFNKISDWENALVISKSTELSPNLADLENSEFLKELVGKINTIDKKINLFQLGEITSPYLKSLKEFQIINFHTGSLLELSDMHKKGYFYQYNDDPTKINLDIAGICIEKGTKQVQSKAPDHLLRLFAYNQLMKKMGRNYFNKNKVYIDDLVEIANEAYIVSPVSSLIVLESKKDYDRFDIPENENSLKNATIKSSSAVPLSDKGLLIILMIGIFIVTIHKKRNSIL